MWSFPKATISWVHCALAAAFKVATLAQRRGFGAWFQNKEFHGITVSWRRPSRPPYLHGAADSRHGFRTRDFMGSQYLGGGLQGRHTCATPRVRGMVSEQGISWDHGAVAAAFKAATLARCRGFGVVVSEHGISQLRTLRAARSFNVFLPPRPLPAVASNQRYLWYYSDTGTVLSCSITTFLAVLRCESGGVPRRISSSAFSRRVAEPRRYWSREPRRRAARPHMLSNRNDILFSEHGQDTVLFSLHQ